MNINLSQFFPNGTPVGQAVQMPALAAAGVPSFTTAANELFVNNATATITPQSSCSPLLPAAVGATNDIMLSATQTSIAGFQNLSTIPSSGWYRGGFNGVNSQSTKTFYVGGTYYFFGPSVANTTTMSWTSSTDLVNFTPAVQLTPTAAFSISDVAYNAGTWVFLDINGTIVSMTDLTLFTGLTITSLPALVTAGSYKSIAYINAIWYVIGGSSAGGGYRISTSTNLSAWTTAIDSGATGGWPTCICQGAGVGSATEILVGCDSDTILKSTNNGTTFTAVTTATGLGSTTVIKHALYSARTGKYYMAVNNDNSVANAIYVSVSSTGTLATANFTTTYSVGAGAANNTAQSQATMVDTGANIGICCALNGAAHYFYYGATFTTASTALLTATQLAPAPNMPSGWAKSVWVNSTLITTYGNQSGIPPIIAVATGATCSTGIAIALRFPMSAAMGTGWNVGWSGVTYLSGSYYAVNGTPFYYVAGAAYQYFWAFLYKINSTFTLMSCPVAPAMSGLMTIYTNTQYIGLSAGTLNGAGTGINWVGYTYISANPLFSPILTYSGGTLTWSQVTSAGAGANGYQSTLAISGQPASCLSRPKWSSLLNTYVMALPQQVQDSSSSYAAQVVTSSTLTGAPASTLISSGGATQANVSILDVLSNGMVVALTSIYASGWISTLTLNNGIQNFTIYTNSNTSSCGVWEVVSGGFSYLVFAYSVSSANMLSIWRLSTTGAPVPIIQGKSVPNALNSSIATLGRVVSYNGSFYLADTGMATSRNAYMLTPNGATFTVSVAEAYIPGDLNYAGTANTYTTTTGVTVVNPTPVPAVYLPAITGNYFTKVR